MSVSISFTNVSSSSDYFKFCCPQLFSVTSKRHITYFIGKPWKRAQPLFFNQRVPILALSKESMDSKQPQQAVRQKWALLSFFFWSLISWFVLLCCGHHECINSTCFPSALHIVQIQLLFPLTLLCHCKSKPLQVCHWCQQTLLQVINLLKSTSFFFLYLRTNSIPSFLLCKRGINLDN